MVAGSGPGDSLYGLRTALFGEKTVVRDDKVALAAQTEMAQVQQMIDQGDWDQAQQKLQAVSTQVQSVDDVTTKTDLIQQWNELSVKVGTRDANATLPPSSVGEPAAPPPAGVTLLELPAVTTSTATVTTSTEGATTTSPSDTTTSGETTDVGRDHLRRDHDRGDHVGTGHDHLRGNHVGAGHQHAVRSGHDGDVRSGHDDVRSGRPRRLDHNVRPGHDVRSDHDVRPDHDVHVSADLGAHDHHDAGCRPGGDNDSRDIGCASGARY